MSIEEIRENLANEYRNLGNVAQKTGINYLNLWNIKTGKNNNPTYDTLLKLTKYFNDNNSIEQN